VKPRVFIASVILILVGASSLVATPVFAAPTGEGSVAVHGTATLESIATAVVYLRADAPAHEFLLTKH
jgi:hypothetical protein